MRVVRRWLVLKWLPMVNLLRVDFLQQSETTRLFGTNADPA